MRVSTGLIFDRAVGAMQDRQSDLSQTELQLASGKRIRNPSDDPAAAIKVLDLGESLSRIEQYQRNAATALARLGEEEAALEGIGNVIQRVRELAVRGNTDTQSAEDRQSIAAEIRHNIDSYMRFVNSRDANGEYLFSGYRSDVEPITHDGAGNFSYQGDAGQMLVRIGDGRAIAVGDNGRFLMDVPAAGGGATDIGKIMYDLAVSLEADISDPDALTDLDTALNAVLDVRARIGSRVNAVEDQKSANDALLVAAKSVKSDMEDLDYAEAIGRFNQQLAALQASQQSFIKVQGLSLFNFIG